MRETDFSQPAAALLLFDQQNRFICPANEASSSYRLCWLATWTVLNSKHARGLEN